MRIPYGFILASDGVLKINKDEADVISMIFDFYIAGASLGKIVNMLYAKQRRMNIFYQLIGFGALIAMGLSYWQNDKRTILLWQVVANLIFAIHYTLLHACSGALCSFFQIVVLLLFLLQEKFNWSKLVTAIPIVAVFLLIAVVTYETPVTVLPIVASLAALLPFFQSRRWVIQVAGIASGLSWLVYVIAVRSYSGMVTESVLTIITAASLLKKESRKP